MDKNDKSQDSSTPSLLSKFGIFQNKIKQSIKGTLTGWFSSAMNHSGLLTHEETTRNVLKGVLTGAFSSVSSTAIDNLHTNMRVTPNYKFSDWWKNPFKGYKFVVSATIPRNCGIYMLSSFLGDGLQKHGISATGSNTIGYFGAGVLDAILTGPFHVIRQTLFTTEAKTAREVFQRMPTKSMLWKSMWSSHYIVLRNGIFWPTYNNSLEITKKYIIVIRPDDSIAIHELKELGAGGIAGLFSTILSYGCDSAQKFMILNPETKLFEIILNAYKTGNWRPCIKTFYGNIGYALIRMPIAMGLNNVAFDAADKLIDKVKNTVRPSP